MKKVFKIIIVIVVILLITFLIILIKTNGFNSIRFKNEYEKLNNTENSYGKKIRNLNIDMDNPFVYKEAEDIVKMIDNKESFVVYFGFASCPWCRSILPTFANVLKELNYTKIYYVDVLEIRDVLEFDENENIVVKKEATEAYYRLISEFGEVLDEYTIKDKDKNDVSTNEKRIYAPNIVKVVNGRAIAMTTGVSDLEKDPYVELTDSMLKDTYNKIYNLLK